jgi:hypothetical protein
MSGKKFFWQAYDRREIATFGKRDFQRETAIGLV